MSALAALLRQRGVAVLLVGAGSSRFIGYSGWGELLERLRHTVIPSIAFPEGLSDLLDRASFIRTEAMRSPDPAARLADYHSFLRESFRPRINALNHHPFHRTLVRLPFCGIVTTNYDEVLESAIAWNRVRSDLDPLCESLDLCGEERPPIEDWLRGLARPERAPAVLHLHGIWKHPERCVLTREDFATRYFGLAAGPATEPFRAADAVQKQTFHQRVLYGLLSQRPMVTVGFSMDDPAFQNLLRLIREDFGSAPRERRHFAIIDSKGEQDEKDRAGWWDSFGICPVYYPNPSGTHEALPSLIQDLARRVDEPNRPTMRELTERMLRLGE
jgi:hypothetical protein